MMQYIGHSNYIKTFALDFSTFINIMTVKNNVQIIKFENIAGYDIAVEQFQRRCTASYLKNSFPSDVIDA